MPDPSVSGPSEISRGVARPTGRVVAQARYGGPDVLQVRVAPRPAPAAGQVLVRVHATSVNARDWHVMRGEPRVARLLDRSLFGLRRPRVAVRGTDVAGVVEEVGAGVTGWMPGDAVFGEGVGTFADHAVAHADQVASVPAGCTFEQAAALPLAAVTALLCLEETGLEPGGSLVINGASGGVGTFAVQVAKAMGLRTTAVVSTRNVDLVESLGADEVIDYTSTSFTRTGRRWDAVLDLVGNHPLRALGPVVRPGGRLVLSGGGKPGEGRLVGPMKLLVGATMLARFQPFEVRAPRSAITTEALERVSALVAAGHLRPVLDRTFALEDAAAAIRHMETEHPRGKVIITTA